MLPVIAGVEGLVLTPRERELFLRLQPAGYILFTRNIADVFNSCYGNDFAFTFAAYLTAYFEFCV